MVDEFSNSRVLGGRLLAMDVEAAEGKVNVVNRSLEYGMSCVDGL